MNAILDEIRKKKASEKGPKKGYCERWVSASFFGPFSYLFFGSLYPFHAVWVLLWFLKGYIAPHRFKKDWGEFFRIL
jgi:hypothetical protein